ncbi:hypothetical protein OROMI_013788 [Orobanche minor]
MSSLVFSTIPPPLPVEKPPDDSGGGVPNHVFMIKLLGNKTALPVHEQSDLLPKGLSKIAYEYGNCLLPRIYIEDSVFQELCHPGQESLIVKILGKNLGYKTMKYKLAQTWKLMGDFDLMDIDNGYFMVKFDSAEDLEKVIGGGLWMIFDHYLAVAEWCPAFVSDSAKSLRRWLGHVIQE